MKAPYYTFANKFLTLETPNEAGDDLIVYTVKYSMHISLEKVVFCELYNPPIKDPTGATVNQKCKATKKCALVKANMDACLNENNPLKGLLEANCPQHDAAKAAFSAKMRHMQAIVCAKI